MLWRHLFEDHLDSPQFAQKQLPFEQHLYKQVLECYRSETLGAVEKTRCAHEVETRLQQYSLAVQWIITQREKNLKVSLSVCRGQELLSCIKGKTGEFINGHLEQDKTFLSVLQDQLREGQSE